MQTTRRTSWINSRHWQLILHVLTVHTYSYSIYKYFKCGTDATTLQNRLRKQKKFTLRSRTVKNAWFSYFMTNNNTDIRYLCTGIYIYARVCKLIMPRQVVPLCCIILLRALLMLFLEFSTAKNLILRSKFNYLQYINGAISKCTRHPPSAGGRGAGTSFFLSPRIEPVLARRYCCCLAFSPVADQEQMRRTVDDGFISLQVRYIFIIHLPVYTRTLQKGC